METTKNKVLVIFETDQWQSSDSRKYLGVANIEQQQQIFDVLFEEHYPILNVLNGTSTIQVLEGEFGTSNNRTYFDTHTETDMLLFLKYVETYINDSAPSETATEYEDALWNFAKNNPHFFESGNVAVLSVKESI